MVGLVCRGSPRGLANSAGCQRTVRHRLSPMSRARGSRRTPTFKSLGYRRGEGGVMGVTGGGGGRRG